MPAAWVTLQRSHLLCIARASCRLISGLCSCCGLSPRMTGRATCAAMWQACVTCSGLPAQQVVLGCNVCTHISSPCQLLGQMLTVLEPCTGGSFQRVRHSRTTGLSPAMVALVKGL